MSAAFVSHSTNSSWYATDTPASCASCSLTPPVVGLLVVGKVVGWVYLWR